MMVRMNADVVLSENRFFRYSATVTQTNFRRIG